MTEAQQLIIARKRANLTQEELATRAGVSTRTISRIENGEKADRASLLAVAAILGVKLGEPIVDAPFEVRTGVTPKAIKLDPLLDPAGWKIGGSSVNRDEAINAALLLFSSLSEDSRITWLYAYVHLMLSEQPATPVRVADPNLIPQIAGDERFRGLVEAMQRDAAKGAEPGTGDAFEALYRGYTEHIHSKLRDALDSTIPRLEKALEMVPPDSDQAKTLQRIIKELRGETAPTRIMELAKEIESAKMGPEGPTYAQAQPSIDRLAEGAPLRSAARSIKNPPGRQIRGGTPPKPKQAE